MKSLAKLIFTGIFLVFFCVFNNVLAESFEEDLRDAVDKISSISDSDVQSKSKNYLEKYNDRREDLLNKFLEELKLTNNKDNRSDWNSVVNDGFSAVSSMESDLPQEAKDKLGDFIDGEKKMWNFFRESPGFEFSRFQIVAIELKTANARQKLNEDWKNIEREDQVLDDSIYSIDNSLKDKSIKLGIILAKGVKLILPPNFQDGLSILITATEESKKRSDLVKQENLVWKTFTNEREVAKKIYEEIDLKFVTQAVDYASGLSNSGNRRDFQRFKEYAIKILNDHKERAEWQYKTFEVENKGKFIGSLETNWLLILKDQKEVDNWAEIFQLYSSDLDVLLKELEKEIGLIDNSDAKKSYENFYNQLSNNSRELIVAWLVGKSIYDNNELQK